MTAPFHIRLGNLLGRIDYPGFVYGMCLEDDGTEVGRWFLRVGVVDGKCNVTGDPLNWWGRKWRLSPHMTDGEIVGTAFKALLTALEHEAREQFTFDGAAVYDSHVDIHKLVALRRDPSSVTGREDGALRAAHLSSVSVVEVLEG